MILVDANLLVYAFMEGLKPHPASRSRKWLEERLNDSPRVGLPWASLLTFVRIASNPRIFEHPTTIESAWRQVEEWLDLDTVWIPEPTPRHRQVLGEILRTIGNKANRVPDAHLAALAIEHDLTLYSADRGFSRFAGLRWENPLRQTDGD